MTRHKLSGGCLLAVAVLAATAATAPGQDLLRPTARGQVSSETYSSPAQAAERIPIPTGDPAGHGVVTGIEFLLLTNNRPIGNQIVAFRGLIDSQGTMTGLPGTYIGSGVPALKTDDLGRTGYTPGYRLTLGYKFEDGSFVYGKITSNLAKSYNASATLAAPFFRSRPDLADTFLVAGVFNFPPEFGGAQLNTVLDDTNRNGVLDAGEGTLTYGIWNGASVMTINFKQWFNEFEVGGRMPLFQTEYSRIYGLAGGRFNWFHERFTWRTQEYDINGNAGPRQEAIYKNTLSQRMYGPFVGCGHEVYLGKRFAASIDLTAAGLLNVIKERAKYELGDGSASGKRSVNDFTVVPSFTGHIHLDWYPIQGVQVRAGYNAWTFFNTKSMDDPIGFNFGAIDPVYRNQAFRAVHGLNVGFALFF